MNLAARILATSGCLVLVACAPQSAVEPRKGATPAQTPGAKVNETANTDTPFSDHPSAAVRSAAGFGGGLLGVVVGLPASVVLLPLTYPVSYFTKDAFTVLYPFGACYYTGGTLFGAMVVPFTSLGRGAAATPASEPHGGPGGVRRSAGR